jgi:hypothetical protein
MLPWYEFFAFISGMLFAGEVSECQAFSPVVRIGSPRPLAHRRLLPSPLWSRGGTHSIAGEGAGGSQFDEGTDTLVPVL